MSLCLYLGAIERDYSVQTIELDEQGVRVPLHMRMVLRQQLQQQLHLVLKAAGTHFQTHNHWTHSCIAKSCQHLICQSKRVIVYQPGICQYDREQQYMLTHNTICVNVSVGVVASEHTARCQADTWLPLWSDSCMQFEGAAGTMHKL